VAIKAQRELIGLTNAQPPPVFLEGALKLKCAKVAFSVAAGKPAPAGLSRTISSSRDRRGLPSSELLPNSPATFSASVAWVSWVLDCFAFAPWP
jgi:hypothetical protein